MKNKKNRRNAFIIWSRKGLETDHPKIQDKTKQIYFSQFFVIFEGLGLGWPSTTDQSNQSLFGTLSRSINPSNSPSSPAQLPSSPAHLQSSPAHLQSSPAHFQSSPAHLPSMFSSPALSVGSDPPTYSLFSGTSWTGSLISGIDIFVIVFHIMIGFIIFIVKIITVVIVMFVCHRHCHPVTSNAILLSLALVLLSLFLCYPSVMLT